MNRVLGTHGLMKQHPQERFAEQVAEHRARVELDRLNDYLMRHWKQEMQELGLEGVAFVMAMMDQMRQGR